MADSETPPAMVPPEPVTLTGDVVRLEPLHPDHHGELLEIALEPKIWEYTLSRVQDEDELRAYIDSALDGQRDGSTLPFVIREQTTGKAVGSTRYGNINPAHRSLEIGWTWVAPAWQRTAINTESKYLLLRHAFETLTVNRVEFKTDALNQTSRRALRRIGATEEGVLRQNMITASGRVRDTVYFSILAAEWPTVKQEIERRLGR